MSASDYAYDSWLRVTVENTKYDGQVRACDGAGVVVNIPGLGQRRVKHAQVLDAIEAPATEPAVPALTVVPTADASHWERGTLLRDPGTDCIVELRRNLGDGFWTGQIKASGTSTYTRGDYLDVDPADGWELVPPTDPEGEADTEEIITLSISSVTPFARNPRQFRRLKNGTVDPDQHGLRQLAESLRTLGQQQPVIVRRLPEGRYGLIDGERRFHALSLAGIATLRAQVREMNDGEALAATVAASNLSEPYGIRDRARAVTWLLSEARTQTQVAELLGIDQGAVSILQRVFALPGPVQELIDQGKLRFGHVRYLVRDHLLQHPKILTRIAEIAAARDARVKDLEPEIPFEAELPIEMVRALRPQERLVLEETLTPSDTEAQNAGDVPQDTDRVPQSNGKAETRTETTTVSTTTTTPAPSPEPPAGYREGEQLAWRKGRAAALRNLAFAPPENSFRAAWVAGWETVCAAPVDPKQQPVKTAIQVAEEKAAQATASAATRKPGALKTAEEKVAEQKGGKPGETRTSALIPNELADRLASQGGTVVTALEDWCKLAAVTGPYELEPSLAIGYLSGFLDACCEREVDPDAAIAAIGGGPVPAEASDAAA